MNSSVNNLETLYRNNNSENSNNSFELNNILNKFCYIESDNNIMINHIYFKQYIKFNKNTLNTLNHLIDQIEKVLNSHDSFNIHLNIKSLTLVEIDKHKDLIKVMSIILKQKFPDKLKNCLIYEAPFIFSALFSLISTFIDKDTQKKIKLID